MVLYTLDFLVVLDNAVMDDGKFPVLREMRMGVAFHGQTMRGPARMTYAGRRQQAGVLFQLGFEVGEFSCGLHDLKFSSLLERHTGRVIAAIFKAMKPLHKQRNSRTMAAVADDPTHIGLL